MSAFWVLLGLACLIGCGTVEQRVEKAENFAVASGFQSQILQTSPFPLYAAKRFSSPAPILHVVIEGDGFAWVDRFQISNDPTPLNPIGLEIAGGLKAGSVAYLGRPCQYVSAPLCNPRMWTDQRFSADVLKSFMSALDQLKAQSGADQMILSGYSGGGYVVMRLAAMRDDVLQVNTVAGVLEPVAWTAYHKISPLSDIPSVTPVQSDVSYMHICGGKDDVVPCALTRRFIAQNPTHSVSEIKSADHSDIGSAAVKLLNALR